MRISDWSSDVCSSDLGVYCSTFDCAPGAYGAPVTGDISDIFKLGDAGQPSGNTNNWVEPNLDAATDFIDLYSQEPVLDQGGQRSVAEKSSGGWFQADFERSEEHTSELQSLMRISYADICLTKKLLSI